MSFNSLYLQLLTINITMLHEFSDAEMYYCDVCEEYLPIGTMYELQDGRIVCEDCHANIEEEE